MEEACGGGGLILEILSFIKKTSMTYQVKHLFLKTGDGLLMTSTFGLE